MACFFMLSAILFSAGSVFLLNRAVFGKRKEENQQQWKKGTTRQPSRIYHDLGRMCHRLRQCMEISVDVRTKRGGGFMLIYLICLLLLGLPVMTMEFSVGRAARTSPIYMYQKLESPATNGDFRYRQSDRQYYSDGILHRRMRLADLLLCEIFNRAESVLRLYTDDSESVRQRVPICSSRSSSLF